MGWLSGVVMSTMSKICRVGNCETLSRLEIDVPTMSNTIPNGVVDRGTEPSGSAATPRYLRAESVREVCPVVPN
eukprot:m.463019 g.463019  ORF g.463019 m.463019 type:complete len:74 (+) comp22865_c0_seq1:876-1097(+)